MSTFFVWHAHKRVCACLFVLFIVCFDVEFISLCTLLGSMNKRNTKHMYVQIQWCGALRSMTTISWRKTNQFVLRSYSYWVKWRISSLFESLIDCLLYWFWMFPEFLTLHIARCSFAHVFMWKLKYAISTQFAK